MEPAKTQVSEARPRTIYVVYAKALKIEWHEKKLGWFVHFDGSWESINFGEDHPEFMPGEVVKISFERAQ